ncbi:MAG: hypothetical protein JRJ69_00175 [Deltaproteobacteria bacterium]|nr:hypothetical protein [Deltaproteobacteria bacterium]MBW2016078.1 hypothetical protein [Deltaproteobacteria bacterium]MBW2130475.1 hypothetical protein [Deltaproteobacteria bacterium]MBW2305105.1 hypothetical protein [Deltaproteobacteria bacterium]
MSIEIEGSALVKACRDMIETVLFCLPNAYKGTIYRIGKPPDLVAERITSGVMDRERNTISWGLPELSEYNPPGKAWNDYRDDPSRPLEAMGWCVEKQKSWTAEDPVRDQRSVRLQVEGIYEDYHHMEPVLVHKSDLHLDLYPAMEFPRNYNGSVIWKDSEYVVVAVIKIHFKPQTITIGSPETKVIKRLSRSLGTELLSYQLRQDSMNAIQQLAKDRLNACNILADSLRNAITKSGLIFSLVKLEISRLRDLWEETLLKDRGEKSRKREAIRNLNETLEEMTEEWDPTCRELINVQNRFLELTLSPEKAENWIEMQIVCRWKVLLDKRAPSEDMRRGVWENLKRLKDSLRFGQDPEIVASYCGMPEDLKREWVRLLYKDYDHYSAPMLDRMIDLLSRKELSIPSKEKSRKTLIQLKALAETMNQLEHNTNFLLRQVLNGGSNGLINDLLNNISSADKEYSDYLKNAYVS